MSNNVVGWWPEELGCGRYLNSQHLQTAIFQLNHNPVNLKICHVTGSIFQLNHCESLQTATLLYHLTHFPDFVYKKIMSDYPPIFRKKSGDFLQKNIKIFFETKHHGSFYK